MNTTDIEHLHERALDLYVEGRYVEAREAWREILSLEPGDARAKEGARMVEILVAEQPGAEEITLGRAAEPRDSARDRSSGPTTVRAASASTLQDSTAREALQIEEQSLRGQYREAADAARRLAQAHPDDASLQNLVAQTRERLEAEAFIEAELSRALKDLQLDDPEDARRACGNVLALDPHHARAQQILGLAEDLSLQTDPSAQVEGLGRDAKPRSGAAEGPYVHAEPGSTTAERVSHEEADELANVPSAPAFEVHDQDPQMQESTVDSPAQAAGRESLLRGDDSVSGSLFDMTDAEVEAIPTGSSEDFKGGEFGTSEAGGREAPSPETYEPLFEMDEDAPSAGKNKRPSAFSEIGAEIDESFEAPSAAGDLSFDTEDHRVKQGTPDASPNTTLSADLSFDSFGDEIVDDPPIEGGLSGAGSDAPGESTSDGRIAALIQEARQHLENGRYSEAIESAARAFAIDEEAPGARQIIDDARRLQDEADRAAEETLDSARHLVEAGDDESAAPLLQKVLEIHPGHRVVLELLDGISRRRTEKEIGGGFVSNSVSGSQEDSRVSRFPSTAAGESGEVPLAPKAPHAQAEPAIESMVPRSHTADAAPRVASGAAATATKDAAAPRKTAKRLILVAALGGGLALAAMLGLYLATRMLEPDAPLEPPATEGPKRKEVIHVDKAPDRRDPSRELPRPVRTVSDAKRMVSEGSLDEARNILFSIVAKDPTNGEAVELLKSVQDKIDQRGERERAMGNIVSAYKQERYEDALRMLYRLPAESQSGDIELYKVNAWYNNGIQNLLGGNCTEAIRCFDEALAINARDEGARRLKEYAKTYLGLEKDTAYLIYVENLPKRPLTAR